MVKDLLGRSTIAVMACIYGDVSPPDQVQIVDRMEALCRRSSNGEGAPMDAERPR